MKPERAAVLLNGMLQTLDMWIEECRALTAECPQAAHLCCSMMQARVSLAQIIARETDP